MLKIRMQRIGRTNDPKYRIVVAEHTIGPKSGKFVERLGAYDPKSKQRSLDAERVRYWLSVGARASGTMHNMLISAGIIDGKKVNVLPKKTVSKKEGEATSDLAASFVEETPADAPDTASVAEEEAAPEAVPETPAETSSENA